MNRQARPTLSVAALLCAALEACTVENVTPVTWKFEFGCWLDESRTERVALRVAEGLCPVSRPTIFESETSSFRSKASRPQGLPAGKYAFQATAYDAYGGTVASVCENIVLPRPDALTLRLLGTSPCRTRDVEGPPDIDPTDEEWETDAGFFEEEIDASVDDAGSTCAEPGDRDGDLVADCVDECPDDRQKVEAGQCGCGKSDADGDDDGTADCLDTCPTDPNKAAPGSCGCHAKTVLLAQEKLLVGQYLCGPRDDSVRLSMEDDGNLHLRVDGAQTWASSSTTDSMANRGISAKMQADGNLVIRTVTDAPVWSSATASTATGAFLSVNADGTLTIVRQDTVVWQVGAPRK